MIYFPQGSSTGQQRALANLHKLLSSQVAVRVGETAVVSTKVHVQDVSRPHEVTAIVNADAGEVFYNRQRPDEVIHIDIFHSEGRVSPTEVGLSIRGALSGLRLETSARNPGPTIEYYVPYIDIQTALGGGRLTAPCPTGRKKA